MATAFEFSKIYEKGALDLNVSNLGCIMLDTEPISVKKHVSSADEALFYGKTPELQYAQGAVAEQSAHVTLLYGLLEKGPKWKKYVDAVLAGWERPATVTIDRVTFFPGREGYDVVIGKVAKTPEILDAHQRLSCLPHIDTHPVYTPHLTLAYVVSPEGGYTKQWVKALNDQYQGAEIRTTGLNYGGS